MKYDVDDIERRVEEKKHKFYTLLAVSAFLIIAAVIVVSVYPETTVVFVCAAIILATVVSFLKYISKNSPLIIFSKGLRGTNVKEHEYVTAGTRITRYGGISYRYIPSRHRGDVYIRTEEGDVRAVCHLPKKHLDIYEIGDTLVVFPGTRYPVVEGRDAREMPCPICGYVNGEKSDACASCGLKTVKNRR